MHYYTNQIRFCLSGIILIFSPIFLVISGISGKNLDTRMKGEFFVDMRVGLELKVDFMGICDGIMICLFLTSHFNNAKGKSLPIFRITRYVVHQSFTHTIYSVYHFGIFRGWDRNCPEISISARFSGVLSVNQDILSRFFLHKNQCFSRWRKRWNFGYNNNPIHFFGHQQQKSS